MSPAFLRDPDGYNIRIDVEGAWTSALQDAFTDAADLVSGLIVGDLADVFFRDQITNDLKITIQLNEIYGINGVLGQADPTAIRTADYLPAVGVTAFDSADAEAYPALDLWDEIVPHEMLHTVGFGSIRDDLGLVAASGSSDPIFTGDPATRAYQSLFDDTDAAGVRLRDRGARRRRLIRRRRKDCGARRSQPSSPAPESIGTAPLRDAEMKC